MNLILKSVAGVLFAGLLLPGCAPVDVEEQLNDTTETEVDDVTAANQSLYFTVRQDMRRCISPVCGGYWVRRVNRSTTRCSDGQYRNECYVAEIDWTGLGLADRALDEFRGAAVSGHGVLRARMIPHNYGSVGTFGQLIAMEGWQSATDATATGTFYQVTNNGRVCITSPCFSYDEQRLNYSQTINASSVDLTQVAGVTQYDIDKGNDYLANSPDGILVAGRNRTVTNSWTSTNGRELVASQFYYRAAPGVSDSRFCMQTSDCVTTGYNHPISSSDECYCANCATTIVNTTTARANARDYQQYCSDTQVICPRVLCRIPPTPACINHACVPSGE